MTNQVWDLWNHVNEIYKYREWDTNTQKQEYAEEIYSRILIMAKHCLYLIEDEADSYITVPSII